MAERKQSPLEIKTTDAHMCTISVRPKILGQLPFFQGLSSADLELVNSLFHETDFSVDQIINLTRDSAGQLFVVVDGQVRLLRHSPAGREILLDLLTLGEFFGAIFGLGDESTPTQHRHTPHVVSW